MNRHKRRAIASISRRLGRAIARLKRTNGAEDARIHAASLWRRYVELTGDVSVL